MAMRRLQGVMNLLDAVFALERSLPNLRTGGPEWEPAIQVQAQELLQRSKGGLRTIRESLDSLLDLMGGPPAETAPADDCPAFLQRLRSEIAREDNLVQIGPPRLVSITKHR